jgi:hypothetical protein
MSRAWDAAGATQPFVQDWNASGYLWNVVPAIRVEAGTGQPAVAGASGSPSAVPEVRDWPQKVKAACIGCHGEDMISGQRLTRGQWDREMDKMIRWGAVVKPEDRQDMVEFLLRNFGPQGR